MLQDLLKNAYMLKGKRDSLVQMRSNLIYEIDNLEADLLVLEQVVGIFQTLVDLEVKNGVAAVESILTDGLRSVFDDQDLSVKAELELSRGKVSVDLTTIQRHIQSVVEGSGPDTFGGSVVTLQSILLRTIIILRRGLRPVLFLDETLPAVDSNYTANIAVFLSDLCKKLGMDILVVTHNPTLFEMADNRYKIVRKNGESWFEKV
jgi:ABC-type dipeptide/oligopeptide/nickel transport system ATPase subunit